MVLGASGAAIAMALVFTPMPAFSQQECGAPAGGAVTCDAADADFPTFANGITYAVEDLTVTLGAGIDVNTAEATAIDLSAPAGGSMTLYTDDQTDYVTITAAGATAVSVSAGTVDIQAPSIYGTADNQTGIYAESIAPTNG
ncbi:MAG: hypothetical protein AAFV86_00405, partial [Pseudomonadota bacterium]